MESTVNQVMSKRMAKKQQMRWTRRGAHRMLGVAAGRFDGPSMPVVVTHCLSVCADDEMGQPAS